MGRGIVGSLPESWAGGGAFPQLLALNVFFSGLTGACLLVTQAYAWLERAQQDCRPCITRPQQQKRPANLSVHTHSYGCLAGTIPATWTQPNAFPSLINLGLNGNGLSGGWNDSITQC